MITNRISKLALTTSSTTSKCFLRYVSFSSSSSDPRGPQYRSVFRESIKDPESFWGEVAENTVWTKPWTKVVDNSDPPFTKWFVGGRLSFCYNAIDRHVDAGNGDKTAVIWDSQPTGTKRAISYRELQTEVSKMSGLLSSLGVGRGDCVLIYMPMIPETLVAMLATIRLGAMHSLVFGGFAAKELATRIKHCHPKVILTASCGLEPTRIVNYKWMVHDALAMAHASNSVQTVVFQRPGLPKAHLLGSAHNEHDWMEAVAAAKSHDCVDVDANDPLYILYTSGTTGQPKGVQHPVGGHAVVNKWTMKNIYDISPSDVWWAASDLGWIVGHEYICYSPLLNGNTTILFEGKPMGMPGPETFKTHIREFHKTGHIKVEAQKKALGEEQKESEFMRVIRDHGVNGFFTAPTAIRSIMKEIGDKHHDREASSSLRSVFLAGELLDEETRTWAKRYFKTPIINHWWQTETGHAITANCLGLGNDRDQPRDSVGFPVPGFDLRVVDDHGHEVGANESGRIVCKLPLPPGTFSTLYKADERFKMTYFENFQGYYDTMDAGFVDEHGYVYVSGREDDVINVSGHRLSTLAVEESVLEHPDIDDCAVIGIPDRLKGQLPLALYVRRKGTTKSSDEISDELIALVRHHVGPVAAFRLSTEVSGLPRTRSGKTARKSIAQMAEGKKIKIPPTIEDASVYKSIKKGLEALNLGVIILEPEY